MSGLLTGAEEEETTLLVIVHDLGGLWRHVGPLLDNSLPLRNVSLPSRDRSPVVLDQLHIKFLPSHDERALALAAQTGSPFYWWCAPFACVILVATEDVADYRERCLPAVRAAIASFAEARSPGSLDWIVAHCVTGRGAGGDGAAAVWAAITADFDTPQAQRCCRIHVASTAQPPSRWFEEVHARLEESAYGVLLSRIAAYETELLRLRATAATAGQPAASRRVETEAALLVQEGLAALFEAAGMAEQASRELDALWAAAAGAGDDASSRSAEWALSSQAGGGWASAGWAAAGTAGAGDEGAGRTGLPFFGAGGGPGDERARLLPAPGEGAAGGLPSIAKMSSLVPTGSLTEFDLLQRVTRRRVHGFLRRGLRLDALSAALVAARHIATQLDRRAAALRPGFPDAWAYSAAVSLVSAFPNLPPPAPHHPLPSPPGPTQAAAPPAALPAPAPAAPVTAPASLSAVLRQAAAGSMAAAVGALTRPDVLPQPGTISLDGGPSARSPSPGDGFSSEGLLSAASASSLATAGERAQSPVSLAAEAEAAREEARRGAEQQWHRARADAHAMARRRLLSLAAARGLVAPHDLTSSPSLDGRPNLSLGIAAQPSEPSTTVAEEAAAGALMAAASRLRALHALSTPSHDTVRQSLGLGAGAGAPLSPLEPGLLAPPTTPAVASPAASLGSPPPEGSSPPALLLATPQKSPLPVPSPAQPSSGGSSPADDAPLTPAAVQQRESSARSPQQQPPPPSFAFSPLRDALSSQEAFETALRRHSAAAAASYRRGARLRAAFAVDAHTARVLLARDRGGGAAAGSSGAAGALVTPGAAPASTAELLHEACEQLWQRGADALLAAELPSLAAALAAAAADGGRGDLLPAAATAALRSLSAAQGHCASPSVRSAAFELLCAACAVPESALGGAAAGGVLDASGALALFQPPSRAPRVPRRCPSVLYLDLWSALPDTLELFAATLLLERTGQSVSGGRGGGSSQQSPPGGGFPVARLFHDDDDGDDPGGAAASAAAAAAAMSLQGLSAGSVVLCPVPSAPLRLLPGRNRVPVSVGPLESGRYALGWLTASWGSRTVIVRARPASAPEAGGGSLLAVVASLDALRPADCWAPPGAPPTPSTLAAPHWRRRAAFACATRAPQLALRCAPGPALRQGHEGWIGVKIDWGAAPPGSSNADAGSAAGGSGDDDAPAPPPATLLLRARGGLTLCRAAGALLWAAAGSGESPLPLFSESLIAEDGSVSLPPWASRVPALTAWVRASAASASASAAAAAAVDAELRLPLGASLELRPRAALPAPVRPAFSASASAAAVGPGRSLLSLRLRSLFDCPVRLLSASLEHLSLPSASGAVASASARHPCPLALPPQGEVGLLFEISFTPPEPPRSLLEMLTSTAAVDSPKLSGGGGGAEGATAAAAVGDGRGAVATSGWAIRRPAGPMRAPHLAKGQDDSPRARAAAAAAATTAAAADAEEGGAAAAQQDDGPPVPALVLRYEVDTSGDAPDTAAALAAQSATPGAASTAAGASPLPPPSRGGGGAPTPGGGARLAVVTATIPLPPEALRALEPPSVAARMRVAGPARVGEAVRFVWDVEALSSTGGAGGATPPPLLWAADGPRSSWLCLSPCSGEMAWAAVEGAAAAAAEVWLDLVPLHPGRLPAPTLTLERAPTAAGADDPGAAAPWLYTGPGTAHASSGGPGVMRSGGAIGGGVGGTGAAAVTGAAPQPLVVWYDPPARAAVHILPAVASASPALDSTFAFYA